MQDQSIAVVRRRLLLFLVKFVASFTAVGPMGLSCASSYFKLRHNRSTKTLSNQRPQPSRLINTRWFPVCR
jgi:hypothetical protein